LLKHDPLHAALPLGLPPFLSLLDKTLIITLLLCHWHLAVGPALSRFRLPPVTSFQTKHIDINRGFDDFDRSVKRFDWGQTATGFEFI